MSIGKITDTELLIYRNEGMALRFIGKLAGVGTDRVAHRLGVLENAWFELISKGYNDEASAIAIGCKPHHARRFVSVINKKYR